ncbi:MAG: calcium-binding protein [Gammaproteobacteria bacterium]
MEPDSEPSGFYAIAYKNLDTGEVVVAYRGSEFLSDSGDLAASEAILEEAVGIDAMHQQFIDALEFARRVHDQFEAQVPEITVTGHSLGGTLAQLAADVFGWNGMTFDAPGAKNLTDDDGFQPWLTQHQRTFGHAGTLTNYTVVGSAISGGSGPGIGAGLKALPLMTRVGMGPAAAILVAAGAVDQYRRHSISNIYSYLQAQSEAGHLLQEHVYRYLEHGVEGYSPSGWSSASVLKEFFGDFFSSTPMLTQAGAESLIDDVEALKSVPYFNDPQNLSAREDLIRAEDELRRASQDITGFTLSTTHWSEQGGADRRLTITVNLQHTLELETQMLRLDLPATDGSSGKPLYYTVEGDGLTPVMDELSGIMPFTGIDHYELPVAPGQRSAALTLTAVDDGNDLEDKLNLGSLKVSLPQRAEGPGTRVGVALSIHESPSPVPQPVTAVVLGTELDDRAGDADTDHEPLWGGDAGDELHGYGGSDDLYAAGGDDRLFGESGSDMLYGGADGDRLFGGAGKDGLDGGAGNDILDGGDGNDFLYGGTGDDRLEGGDGSNVLTGGLGSDVLLGGDLDDDLLGDATYRAVDRGWAVLTDTGTGLHTYDRASGVPNHDTGSADTLFAGAGNDALWGGGGDDILYGEQGDDYLQGDSGDDMLDGGAGTDLLYGDNGDDPSLTGDDMLLGGDGDDQLIGGAGADVLQGDDGRDTLIGDDHNASMTTGPDVLLGGAGDDDLYGGPGADRLWGGTGDDYLEGDDYAAFAPLHGNDELHGGPGDDTLFGDGGSDLLVGGVGNDVLYGDQDGVYGLIEGDDHLQGGQGDDQLYGQGGDDVLEGGSGRDVLDGNAGNDWLIGGPGDDYMAGGAGDNLYILNAGSGHDTIELSSDGQGVVHFNDNTRLVDVSASATVAEQYDYFSLGRPYRARFDVTLAFGAQDTVTLQDGLRGNATGFELADRGLDHWEFLDAKLNIAHGSDGDDALAGGAADDVLLGEAGADTLIGEGGDDVMDGGAGADRLQGGTGADSLVGGAGADTYRFDAGDGRDTIFDFDLTSGVRDTVELGPAVKLSSLEFTSNDTGGLVMHYAVSDSVVLAQQGHRRGLGVERLQLFSGPSFDMDAVRLAGVGRTQLLGVPDRNGMLQGAASADVLIGRNGDEWLRGLAGDDIMDGGVGDDYLFGDGGSDSIDGGDGTDRIHGGAGGDELFGQQGNDRLYGDGGSDTLFGHSGDDLLVGGAGNDHLSGDRGADTYLFGSGDGRDVVNEYDSSGEGSVDMLRFQAGIAPQMLHFEKLQDFYSGRWSDLRIDVGGGGDSVTIDNHLAGPGYQLERIQFADGTAFALGDVQVGGDGEDVLAGNDGGSVLQGGGGDDELTGGSGDDLLLGGADMDHVAGGGGADYLVAGSGDDVLRGDGGGDWLLAGTGNDQLYGGGGDDRLQGGSATAGVWTWDALHGGSGDDELIAGTKATLLWGESGNDTMTGGSAWNVLWGGPGDDQLVAGAGTTYMDAGTGNDVVSGGAMSEWLIGGEGDDRLYGAAGDDTLQTGAGNDSAYGGDGDDRLQGGSVTEGVWTWDALHGGAGDDALVAGAKSAMLWGEAGDDTLTGGSAWNALWGGDGNDRLEAGAGTTYMDAGAGNDRVEGVSGSQWIFGGSGDDRLHGGEGVDQLTGGVGNDTYVFARGDGRDTVRDMAVDAGASSTDRVRFGDGIAADQLWFERQDVNLEVSVLGSSDAITVQDWYAGSDHRVDAFVTAGGASLLAGQVQQLVTAMAAFAPPASGEMNLPPAYQTELQPVIAAAWQPAA